VAECTQNGVIVADIEALRARIERQRQRRERETEKRESTRIKVIVAGV
jgi:predicted RNase H-like nuclease (RuvC/YqgF family)